MTDYVRIWNEFLPGRLHPLNIHICIQYQRNGNTSNIMMAMSVSHGELVQDNGGEGPDTQSVSDTIRVFDWAFVSVLAIKGKTSRMSHSFLGFGRSHCHRTNSTLDMSDLIVCLCGLLRAMTWPEQIHHHNSKLHKNNRRKKKHRIISSDDISMSIDFALYAFTHRITITTSEAIHTTILHTKTICKYRHKKIKELGMQSSCNKNKK